MGLISTPPKQCAVWIHAASVGEVMASLPLLHASSARHSTLVTTNTPEAARLLASEFGDAISHCYCPVDFAWAVRRLINKYQPRQLFVMETELWPNLFEVSASKGLSPIVVNGRLSAKTLQAPKLLLPLYRRLLGGVTAVWARSHTDAHGFEQLGCDPEKITAVGNIKYGSVTFDKQYAAPREVAAVPYVLAASTHEGEEQQLAMMWRALSAPPLLVLMPRQPRRGDTIVHTLREEGLKVSQKSRGEAVTADTQIYVADTLGELRDFASGAQWVFMGGSLVDAGGHNLLEPAALGKAVVSGRHLSNFKAEADYLLSRRALVTVSDTAELQSVFERFALHPNELTELGSNASAAIREARDVGDRYRSLFGERLAELAVASS
ncbi:MAG: glycosyltransferase N-terminal domain-containing protein [Halieaceae bacterium]|jgi:3-deoxy-D-manno-octulosonic-acid transferase|nr:glycosyltransferase N-terminal domain-containing protein [Halieaceae bacterium]